MARKRSRPGRGLERRLETLEQLLGVAAERSDALGRASSLLAGLFAAEKVDVFLYEPAQDSLRAEGTGDTELSRKQRALGLDHLPLSNGGRAVEVFRTGKPWLHAHQDRDPGELAGIRLALRIKSQVAAPIAWGGQRRGVLALTDTRPAWFDKEDLALVQAAAGWIGVVAHRAEAVEALTRQALEEGRRRAAEELITVLAHDLGNLLMPLTTRLELLQLRARSGRPAGPAEVAAAQRVAKRLGGLVHDLLDVNRLDRGVFALSLQPFDLAALVREVAELATGPSREVQVRGPTELPLVADPARLRQVLENLLANAVQHSPEGEPVMVEYSPQLRRDGRWVVLEVRDHGPGIAGAVLSTLFERYAAGPSSRGLGLGLYLARQIAQAHRGSLEVRSSPGAGTCFVLALPAEGPGD